MLLSKIKEIKNGRMIKKTTDADKTRDYSPSDLVKTYKGHRIYKDKNKGDVSYYKHFNIYETGMGDFRAELEPSMSKFYVGKPSFVGRSVIEIKSLIDQWQQTHSTDSKMKDVEPSSEQIGKIVGLVMSSEKDPTRAIAMIQNKISSEFHLSMEEREKLLPQIKMAISVYNNSSKDSKMKDSLKDDYAEKLFNKLWDELTPSQKEEIKRHIEYDITKGVK